MLPPVSNNKMIEYLQNSSIFVSPSLFDGTSISLLEAMACGLPVIVTDYPSNLEWIQNNYNGLIVKRAHSIQLTESLTYLIENRNTSKVFGNRNRHIAEERADIRETSKRISNIVEEYIQ